MLTMMLSDEGNSGLLEREASGEAVAYTASGVAPQVLRVPFGQIDILIFVTMPAACGVSETGDLLTVTRAGRPGGGSMRVYIESAVLHGHLSRLQGQGTPGEPVVADPCHLRDPATERLARMIVAAGEAGQGLGALYVDAICLALVTRLLGVRRDLQLPATNRFPKALPKWRLRRVIDYVDAHLAEPVTLGDMASAAGLTRMHFAAQFRAAMGVRPHEYFLRRRIERAQELLASTKEPLVDVALSVGFQTQAHFTTVFRRFAHETPNRWRRAALDPQLAS